MNLNSISACVLSIARELDNQTPRTPSRERTLSMEEDPDQFGPVMEDYFTRTLRKVDELKGRGMEALAAEEAAIAWLTDVARVEMA